MAATEPMAGDFGPARRIVAAPGDPRFQHLGWPKVVRAGDGALVVAALAGRTHTQGGCPAVCRSTDGGRTFGDLAVLLDVPGQTEFDHSGNVALGKASDGSLVLLAMVMRRDDARTGILGWRSEDHGRTWQVVDTTAISGEAGSVYGHVFPTPEGLCVAGHGRKGARLGATGIWLAYSCAEGRTWGPARRLTDAPLVEPALIHVGDRYVGLIRGQIDGPYCEALSNDGRQWTWARSDVGRGVNLPCPFLVADPADGAVVWALATSRGRGIAPGGGGEAGIWLWRGNLDGKAIRWRQQATVARFEPVQAGEPDYGYPWMAHVESRRWLVVMYCGHFRGPNALWAVDITV